MKFAHPWYWRLAICVAATVATAQAASPLPLSQPSQQGFSAERLQRVDALVQSVIANGDYAGAVTLIARNGKVVAWRAHGHRDLAKAQPMERDSIFRIYSMTKTVASVAVLMLIEEGKLALDDPVGRFLPDFAGIQVFAGGRADAPQLRPAKRAITVRHLLTHTAGFATGGNSNTGDDEAVKLFKRVDLHHSPDLKAYAEQVARLPLAVDPGERFAYDGVGIEVLGRLVEVVSGMPFDAFLQQRIFTPLKMQDTGFSVPRDQRPRIVDMLTTDADGKLVLTASRDAVHPGDMLNPYPSGAGGLYSTAGDYARFCQMLLNGGSLDGVSLLGRKTVELMMLNHLGDARVPAGSLREGEGFGLGGYVVQDVARRERHGSIGQFGWSGAGSTYFTIDRQEKLMAILLMQHLPQGLPKDPPKISAKFYNTVYQALVK